MTTRFVCFLTWRQTKKINRRNIFENCDNKRCFKIFINRRLINNHTKFRLYYPQPLFYIEEDYFAPLELRFHLQIAKTLILTRCVVLCRLGTAIEAVVSLARRKSSTPFRTQHTIPVFRPYLNWDQCRIREQFGHLNRPKYPKEIFFIKFFCNSYSYHDRRQ